jgi:zinc transport system substrate-binding protein
LLIFINCSREDQETVAKEEQAKPKVIVSNYPLQYFVERISSGLVDIKFPARVSGDPAYWQPTAEDILTMQQADLILLNGASYEKWIKNVSLPQSKMVETTEGFNEQFIPLEETVTHSHGMEGDHEHSGTAFTTWLDPALAAKQAHAVRNALIRILPKYKSLFEEQYVGLEKDLIDLDKQLQQIIKSPEIPVLFSHPVYQYLENRYKISGMSVHWEPDQMPDDAMWKELKHILHHHKAKWMIWEDQPMTAISKRLNATDIKSIVFNPCGNIPDSGDYLKLMNSNLEQLKLIYQ